MNDLRKRAKELAHNVGIRKKNEYINELEKALIETDRRAREEALEEAANFIKAPCPYYPDPCGDCRHCFLTKAAIRIRNLKPKKSKRSE